MKLKVLIQFMLMTLMMLCFSQYLLAEVSLSIDPPSAHSFYGEDLTLSVNVAGIVEDLRAFEIELTYDPASLSIAGESAFEEGDFLSTHAGTDGTQWYVREGSAPGSYILSCSLLGGITQGATGDGTLFKVTFQTRYLCSGPAGTEIRLPSYILRGILNQPITVNKIGRAHV